MNVMQFRILNKVEAFRRLTLPPPPPPRSPIPEYNRVGLCQSQLSNIKIKNNKIRDPATPIPMVSSRPISTTAKSMIDPNDKKRS